MIGLPNEVVSPRLVRPETPLEAASCLYDLCQHIGRVMRGGSEPGIRAAMISDGADQGKSDHFTYSWIRAVMPHLHESEAERVMLLQENPVTRTLTLILSPHMKAWDSFHFTMDLPLVFWQLDEDARWMKPVS